MSGRTEKASDIFFAGARAKGAWAADEPDPQRRCELYMSMLESDLKAVEYQQLEAQWEAADAARRASEGRAR